MSKTKNVKTKKKQNLKSKVKNKTSIKKDYSLYYYVGLIVVILIIFLISTFKTMPEEINTDTGNLEKDIVSENPIAENDKDNDPTIESSENPAHTQEIIANYQIDKTSTLDDFIGRNSVILFAGTYCGHCKTMVPEFKTRVWDNYKETTNIWVQVINDDTFDVEEVPQGLNKNLDFDNITNSECRYIPSFVVLDKEGKVLIKSCGSEKNIDDIINTLDSN